MVYTGAGQWCKIDGSDVKGLNMAKQLITLVCENCGRKFEARAHRRVVHCLECAEELRRRGLGQVQIRRTTPVTEISSKMQAKQISWERAESDLSYYLKRFNRFPAYDGVMPSDLDHITDKDRQIANKIAARMSPKIWAPIVGESIVKIGDWNLLDMTPEGRGELSIPIQNYEHAYFSKHVLGGDD